MYKEETDLMQLKQLCETYEVPYSRAYSWVKKGLLHGRRFDRILKVSESKFLQIMDMRNRYTRG